MELESRDVAFEVVRAEPDGDGLTLEGYAAVFDSPTRIDSWEGEFIERIKPGAFKKSLRERTPVLMFNHGQHPFIGSMPIGHIKRAREDSEGLYVEARLAGNWMMEPVREAIEQGAVDGMSFRFQAIKEEWREPKRKGGIRERDLLEVRVAELGPVVFPAYEKTTVSVRSQDLIDVLEDEDQRSELARALFCLQDLGTSTEAVREDTSQEAAGTVEPQPHSISNAQRIQSALALKTLEKISNG